MPHPARETSPLVATFQAVFDQVMDGFGRNDFAAIRQLWDTGASDPYYVAEEHEVLCGSWEELQAYWDATAAINTDFIGNIEVVRAKQLAPGVAVCQFRLRWKMTLSSWNGAAGGFNRGMAVFVERDGIWKLSAYIEAPMAAITYLSKLDAADEVLQATRKLYMDYASGLTLP